MKTIGQFLQENGKQQHCHRDKHFTLMMITGKSLTLDT